MLKSTTPLSCRVQWLMCCEYKTNKDDSMSANASGKGMNPFILYSFSYG